ncbi:MAG TPA: type IV pilus modification protein PilV [Chthoniobacteraceae bacterium]|nr:type IV pilus modification protein PilV [Chthoniobacteraceae bacterium]
MSSIHIVPRRYSGFTMIEALVSLVIIMFGLLGLAGLQTRMQQAEFESYQRSQALILLYDMVDRINTNRATVPCFVVTTDLVAGANYLGAGAAAPTPCGYSTTENNAIADIAIAEWDNLLKGSAETKGVNQVGAMIGARGCISYNSATELPDAAGAPIAGTGIFTVAVAWQGTSETIAPTVACANNLYGTELRRRVVSETLRLANLK